MLGHLDEKMKTFAQKKEVSLILWLLLLLLKLLLKKSDNEHLKLIIDLDRWFWAEKSFSPYGFCNKSFNYLETGDT